MRRNSSTMTFAPTAIDDGSSYVFVSSEIEDTIVADLDTTVQHDPSTVVIKIDGKSTTVTLRFASRDDAGDLLVCVEPRALFSRLLDTLIVNGCVDVTLADRDFKAHVTRVEFEQAYLKILEG